MEIINQLVMQHHGDFSTESIQNFLDTEISFEELLEKSDKLENAYHKVQSFYQWMHGSAYLKCKDKEEEKIYCSRYKLKPFTIGKWARTVKVFTNPAPGAAFSISDRYPDLPFTQFQVSRILMEKNPKKGLVILDEAQAGNLSKRVTEKKCSAIIEEIVFNKKIDREVRTKKISRKAAKKIVFANDAEARKSIAAKAKKKAYNKAKKITEEYEATPGITMKTMVSKGEALDALKLLFTNAAKQCHSDKGGKGMENINAANEALKTFVNYWI